jgi:putative ABC transport system permease protein
MREPLLRGRDFTPADVGSGARVVIINQTLASSYFAGRDPIGQAICFDRVPDSTSTWRTIVGVVGDERQLGLDRPAKMEVYEPFAQDAANEMTLMIRSSGDTASLAPAVRRIDADADHEVPIVRAITMDARMAESMARERFVTTLFLLFAAVGVTLAVVGVYGVLAQLARRRTREIGIRIALGAASGQVRWMVVRHGLRLVVTGVAIGGAVALLATREMQALLFGISALDPATFVAVPLVLALAGIAASWIPARQASRADPVEALRAE